MDFFANLNESPVFHNVAREVISGFSAGVLGTLLGHPLDTIKVRMQTDSRFSSPLSCGRTIVQEEGFKALFRGIGSPLVSLTFLNSISFFVYGQFKQLMWDTNHRQQYLERQQTSIIPNTTPLPTGTAIRDLQLYEFALAGLGTGVVASGFSIPFEVVKVVMQLNKKSKTSSSPSAASPSAASCATGIQANQPIIFKNSFDCARHVIRQRGFKSLFTSWRPMAGRESFFCLAYFPVYELVRGYLTPEGQRLHIGATLLSGGLAGMSGWLACYHFDTVKNVVIANALSDVGGNGSAAAPKRLNTWEATKLVWTQQGFAGFYRGLSPTLTRSFCVSACRFLAYEYMMELLNEKWPRPQAATAAVMIK